MSKLSKRIFLIFNPINFLELKPYRKITRQGDAKMVGRKGLV